MSYTFSVKTDWAYIAGFLDGEGSIRSYQVRKNRGKIAKRPRLGFEICFYNTNKAVLEWILSVVKDGFLYPRKLYKLSKNRCWALQIRKQLSVKFLIDKLMPYLKIKKDRAKDLLLQIEGWQNLQAAERGISAPISSMREVASADGRE